MTEASSSVEHGKLPQEVSRRANDDAESRDQPQRLEAWADPSLEEEFDPACDRSQPEVEQSTTLNLS